MSKTPWSPTILVVEDQSEWAKLFPRKLQQAKESRTIVVADLDILDRYTTPEHFDVVQACFVDLELGASTYPGKQDVSGLTRILPHIRSKAPWIPVACISRYIRGDDVKVIGDLSASDFDFFCPKTAFAEPDGRTNPEFNAEKWQQILRAMLLKRNSVLTGRCLHDLERSVSSPPRLTLPSRAKAALAQLDVSADAFAEALALVGIEGSELSVDPLTPGFSGVNVSRVTASGSQDQLPVLSHWLIKWGRPQSKLVAEAAAHKRLLHRGFNRALQIPQAIPSAAFWGGIGLIAYAFEGEAIDGLKTVTTSGLDAIKPPLNEAIKHLFHVDQVRHKSVDRDSELIKWCAVSEDELKQAKIPERDTTCEVSWALIHGDFHLRNMFVTNGRPTLIDFARSSPGPIAIDAAKMVVDLMAFGSTGSFDWPTELTWTGVYQSSPGLVLGGFEAVLKRTDDTAFLLDAIRAFAFRYLGYEDVEERVKRQFRTLLGLGQSRTTTPR